jgi:sugar lactone lactonase YvrE
MRSIFSAAILLCFLLFFFDGCNDNEARPSDYDIYVSDATSPYQILKYDGNGNNADVFIDHDLNWSQDILFREDDGVVLVSNLIGGKILRFNAADGGYIDEFASGISGPTRMKIGADNLLYVLQWNNSAPVLRYELDGTFVDEFTSVGIGEAIGIDWDAAGNLYVSSFTGRYVKKFDPSGNDLGIFTNTALQGPTNIWFDASGNLLVLDYKAGVVRRYDSTGKFLDNVITGLSRPEGVAVLPDGKIMIGNGGTGSVKMYDQDFKFLKDVVKSKSGGLKTPNVVVIRARGY